MKKLIFIDGLPGSGKTATENFLEEKLQKKGYNITKFEEFDLYPRKLIDGSKMSKDDYQGLCEMFPDYQPILDMISSVEDENVYTAHNTVHLPEKLKKELLKYPNEIIEDKDLFLSLFKKKWQQCFLANIDSDLILAESALFQNYINECVFVFNMTEDEVLTFTNDLLNIVKDYSTSIIYLKTLDINLMLEKTISSRVPDNDIERSWKEVVYEIVENFEYEGVTNNDNFTALCQFFKLRQDFELNLLKRMNTNQTVINVDPTHTNVGKRLMEIVNTLK